jgi:hypothetical protein
LIAKWLLLNKKTSWMFLKVNKTFAEKKLKV